jgi:hypothetical protein
MTTTIVASDVVLQSDPEEVSPVAHALVNNKRSRAVFEPRGAIQGQSKKKLKTQHYSGLVDSLLLDRCKTLLRQYSFNRPFARYMESMQISLRPHMRKILVEWMLEIAHENEYQRETMHMAVNIVDRFLSVTRAVVQRTRFQLLGIAAMFIAR